MKNKSKEMFELADEYFRKTLEANLAEPYVHAEYERQLSLARAALYLACEGDGRLAFALEQCFHDSNEPMAYYLTKWPREELANDYDYSREGLPMVLTFKAIH